MHNFEKLPRILKFETTENFPTDPRKAYTSKHLVDPSNEKACTIYCLDFKPNSSDVKIYQISENFLLISEKSNIQMRENTPKYDQCFEILVKAFSFQRIFLRNSSEAFPKVRDAPPPSTPMTGHLPGQSCSYPDQSTLSTHATMTFCFT